MKKIIVTILIIIPMIKARAQSPLMINTTGAYSSFQSGFSQGIQVGNIIFLSGQVGWNADYQLSEVNDFKSQVDVAMNNINSILTESNSSMSHVVHLRFYVVELTDAKKDNINNVLAHHFQGTYRPATTLLGVVKLAHDELLIEIETVATTINK